MKYKTGLKVVFHFRQQDRRGQGIKIKSKKEKRENGRGSAKPCDCKFGPVACS